MLFASITILILAGVVTILGNLGKAREVAKELGDPEYLMKSIQEIEKLKDSIDKK